MAVRERIIFSENRDRRSVTLAELGAKGGLKAAHAGFHFESQLAHCARQQVRGEMLFELEFRMLVDLMTEAGDNFAVRIDCTGYFRMSIHRAASNSTEKVGIAGTALADHSTPRRYFARSPRFSTRVPKST